MQPIVMDQVMNYNANFDSKESNHPPEASLLRKSCRCFVARRCPSTLLAVLFLGALVSARVSAVGFVSGTVDFDYNFAAYGYAAYGPGPGAIGSAGDVWNTASTIDTSPLNLYDANGNPTSLVWSLSGGGGLSTYLGGTYGSLMDVSTYIGSASISGLIPGHAYNLYLYSVYWDETINVNGANFSTVGIRYGGVDSLSLGSQYDTHTVFADNTGTLAFTPVSAEFGTPYISSWQLTPVPEPGPISLAGVGLAVTAMTKLARRRNRRN